MSNILDVIQDFKNELEKLNFKGFGDLYFYINEQDFASIAKELNIENLSNITEFAPTLKVGNNAITFHIKKRKTF